MYVSMYVLICIKFCSVCKCNALILTHGCISIQLYLATEKHMGPKEAYKEFEKQLLETLNFAADQPNFIALLKEKDIISDEKTMRKLDMPYETEGNRAVYILKEIRKSLPVSDTKFNNLLTVMEEYKQGLETLAQKIQIHLDPSMYEFVHT